MERVNVNVNKEIVITNKPLIEIDNRLKAIEPIFETKQISEISGLVDKLGVVKEIKPRKPRIIKKSEFLKKIRNCPQKRNKTYYKDIYCIAILII